MLQPRAGRVRGCVSAGKGLRGGLGWSAGDVEGGGAAGEGEAMRAVEGLGRQQAGWQGWTRRGLLHM